jgi:hypothetical protein
VFGGGVVRVVRLVRAMRVGRAVRLVRIVGVSGDRYAGFRLGLWTLQTLVNFTVNY